MAKPFYSLEEVCEKLNKSEDDVKELVRDGSLREFRDAGKVFFKADDVDKLAGGGTGSGDALTLEAADELPDLSDAGGTGALNLSDEGTPGGTSLIGLAPSDDETDAGDKKAGTMLSSSGIGVFDDDELEIEVDPLAATHVSESPSAPAGGTDFGGTEASSPEGTGSGLLDLEREADDTKLGAELLDEIYPGEDEDASAATPPPAPAMTAEPDDDEEDIAEPAPAAPVPMAPTAPAAVAYAGDNSEAVFGGILAGALVPLVVAGSVGAAALQQFQPSYTELLSNQFWFFLGGAVLVVVIGAGVGWAVGRR